MSFLGPCAVAASYSAPYMRRTSIVLLSFVLLTVAAPAAVADIAQARAFLGELVGLDTSNPPGNEAEAVDRVAAHLRAAGLKPEIVTFAPGRSSIVVRLKGNGKKRPLLLLAHLDVVGARDQPWTVPPFRLTEQGGWLFGRGVLDDKGWAAIALDLLLERARTRRSSSRDLILALTGDEESGGAGIKYLLAHKRELLGDAEVALNEGGSLKLDGGKVVSVSFQPAEKTFQNYELVAHGVGGHSSVPNDDNAIYRLARALDHISAFSFAVRLGATVRESLRLGALTQPAARAHAMQRIAEAAEPPADALQILDSYPLTRAMIRTTCVATLASGGTRDNALPMEARATINCRVMPGDRLTDVQRQLANVVGDSKVDVKVVGDLGEGPEAPVEGITPAAIRAAAQKLFGAVPVIPTVGAGASDSRFLRQIGIAAYGIGVVAKPEEQQHGAHGPDEGAPVEGFEIGTRWLRAIVDDLTAD